MTAHWQTARELHPPSPRNRSGPGSVCSEVLNFRTRGKEFEVEADKITILPCYQVEDLAAPYFRGEAELRGEGRDGLEPVRRRVNPASGSDGALPNRGARPILGP